MAGKGGGAWKVAYADFVTAMMAFFMVMWITSQSDEVKSAVARHFSGPFKPINASGLYEPLFSNGHERPRPDSELSLEEDPKNGDPNAKTPPKSEDLIPDKSGKGRNDSSIAHVSGRGPGGAHRGEQHGDARVAELSLAGGGELTAESQKALESAVFVMFGRSNVVEIRSYVPRFPPTAAGRQEFLAWQESQERCFKIKEFLQDRGISASRIRLTQIVGDTANRDNPEAVGEGRYARNARIEVVMHVDPVLDAPEANHAKAPGHH